MRIRRLRVFRIPLQYQVEIVNRIGIVRAIVIDLAQVILGLRREFGVWEIREILLKLVIR